jgi:AcrR family transcriptional regulator
MTRTATRLSSPKSCPTKLSLYAQGRPRKRGALHKSMREGGRTTRARNEAPSGPERVPHYLLDRRERYLTEISMSEPAKTKPSKRGRGRPRLFDRTAAIEQAMELFWDRGYEGTTFDDLIGAMKLSPSSFYHEFGSKERLYREAVDYYLSVSLSDVSRVLSSHRDTRAAFEAFIEETAAFFTNGASPTGCMVSLAGTHLPPHLRSVAEFTKSLRKGFEQELAKRLRKGVSDGDLLPGTNVKELAAYFDTVIRGLAVHARDGASRKQLLAICRVAMRAWPSKPPDTNPKNGSGGSQH